jgi:hypothetical protein
VSKIYPSIRSRMERLLEDSAIFRTTSSGPKIASGHTQASLLKLYPHGEESPEFLRQARSAQLKAAKKSRLGGILAGPKYRPPTSTKIQRSTM